MDIIDFQNDETIAAISTPLGEGGISVIRISGKESYKIIRKIFKSKQTRKSKELKPRKLNYGIIVNPKNKRNLDTVLCTIMREPNSYTGEDVVEIHSHGGYLVPKKILELIIEQGARLASPGEFTQRAFLNGKMDLSQAEAVVDIINAQTETSLKQAELQLEGGLSKKIHNLKETILDILAEVEAQVDFPEEDIDPLVKKKIVSKAKKTLSEINKLLSTYETGRIIKNGIYTAILGKPNVGKSSLLNQLLKKERAIVSPIAGTTRDFIEESISIRGIPLRLVDTAGIRSTIDEIEKIGVEFASKKAKEAEFAIVLLDGSEEFNEDDIAILNKVKTKNFIVAINKNDLHQKIKQYELVKYVSKEEITSISAKNGDGIDKLSILIYKKVIGNKNLNESSEIFLTDLRHKEAIEKTSKNLESFLKLLKTNESPEFLAIDLRTALESLGEITGEITTEDLLGRIFSKFCIGK